MAPSPSPERELAPADAAALLDLADASIVEGLRGRSHLIPRAESFSGRLTDTAGSFVTLTVKGSLNGCIGNVVGVDPLAVAVPRLAWSAAFSDPRLPALGAHEYDECTIEISVLSVLSPIEATSRSDLRDRLRPGVDGLVIEAGSRQAVFLPVVWDQLPDPDDFLDHLWRKAEITVGSWPRGAKASRFTATKYGRRAGWSPNADESSVPSG